MSYYFNKTVAMPFDEAVDRVKAELKKDGFGVLTEIDVRKTLHEKLGVDFRPYRILGACNPTFAHQALGRTLDVGMLLPCNVVVYETDDGRTVVSAVDPMQTIAAQGDPTLRGVAEQVQAKLRRVIASL